MGREFGLDLFGDCDVVMTLFGVAVEVDGVGMNVA